MFLRPLGKVGKQVSEQVSGFSDTSVISDNKQEIEWVYRITVGQATNNVRNMFFKVKSLKVAQLVHGRART